MKTTQLLFVILSLLCLCQARPRSTFAGQSRLSSESFIIGGLPAAVGDFPWHLSLQTLSGVTWTHNCGGIILTLRYGLTAATCVSGISLGSLRAVAGLYDQTDMTGTQTVNMQSYTIHAQFGVGTPTFANDIAVLRFITILALGGNVQAALLPHDNSNNYNGLFCDVTGWGRTSNSDILPNIPQRASIPVVTTDTCQAYMLQAPGTSIWDGHICVYDISGNVGACNHDQGSPLHCQDGGTVVAGINSWNIEDDQLRCQQSYPSVYTRVSFYLTWIANNTPALDDDEN